MCHATSAGRKARSVSTNKSQFVDTLSTNKAYHEKMNDIETVKSQVRQIADMIFIVQDNFEELKK